jgi:transcriptional regulator
MTLYVPSHFRVEDLQAVHDFVAANAFGALVTAGPDGLHVSHIPFVVERDKEGHLRLLGHVARANPQSTAIHAATHLVAIFQGPHAYVSPTWYEHHPAVPTWNYAVAHLHGRATPMDDAGLRELLGKLSSTYEAGRPNAWRFEDAPKDFIDKMVGVISGFSIAVEKVEAKFKLSQNRPGNDAKRVVDALEREGEHALAALMREHLPDTPGGKIRP